MPVQIKKGDWVMIKGPKGMGEVQFLGTDGTYAYVSADGVRVSAMDLDRFQASIVSKPQLASLQDLQLPEGDSNEGQGEDEDL